MRRPHVRSSLEAFEGGHLVTKTISALILASIIAVMAATAALAAPDEEGVENGLSQACGNPVVALENPNCGW